MLKMWRIDPLLEVSAHCSVRNKHQNCFRLHGSSFVARRSKRSTGLILPFKSYTGTRSRQCGHHFRLVSCQPVNLQLWMASIDLFICGLEATADCPGKEQKQSALHVFVLQERKKCWRTVYLRSCPEATQLELYYELFRAVSGKSVFHCLNDAQSDANCPPFWPFPHIEKVLSVSQTGPHLHCKSIHLAESETYIHGGEHDETFHNDSTPVRFSRR